MFLKNFNARYSYQFCGRSAFKGCNDVIFIGGTKISDTSWTWDINGSKYTISDLMQHLATVTYIKESNNNSTSYLYQYGVIFGTGNSAPTLDDYAMSGDIISGLSTSNLTYVLSNGSGEDSYYIQCVYTISNTTGADITIGEIGMIDYLTTKKDGSTTWYYPYLFERTAFEEPITIPANGVGQVTYKVVLKAPCLPVSTEES